MAASARRGTTGADGFDAATPIVRARALSRWYGDVIAVNDLSVDIPPGITGVLGPNGAGKSTFIRMIVGLAQPSAGLVRVLGQDPWNNRAVLARIGYVPEAPAPWRDLSGSACAVRAAEFSGLEAEEAELAAERAIERVGLADAAERRVSGYSHGMQQRLKFALALLHDPELLVLDEPLLGTDPIARRDLLKLMQDLASEGRSLLLSTHVLPDVEALTDRVLIMDHGRLLAHGNVGEIRDLLERHPRTVRIETPNPREMGLAVWAWDSVESVHAEPGALTVRTRRASEFYAQLQERLLKGDLAFTSVTSPDDHVETVFRYLVG